MTALPPSSSAWDAAIIDLDGTLVDTLGDFVVALGHMLDDLQLPPVSRAFVEHTIGQGSEHLIRSTLAEAGADAGLYEAGWQSYQRHYDRINGQHSAVFAGVTEGLERLRAAGLRLACLTNKPTAFARDLLRHKGLASYFELTFGGDAFERRKPDPLPLLKTCAALGTVPARTVMLGDSRNDARAGRAAGCPVWLVTYGYNHGEPVTSVDADGYVERLDAIPLG